MASKETNGVLMDDGIQFGTVGLAGDKVKETSPCLSGKSGSGDAHKAPSLGDASFKVGQVDVEMTDLDETQFPVIIGCSDAFAIRGRYTALPNPEGYCHVTQVELVDHFYPEEWRGTVKLSRAVGEMVVLSASEDAEGEPYWNLGPGEYVMTGARKRTSTSLGGTHLGVRAVSGLPSRRASTSNIGPARSATFHTAKPARSQFYTATPSFSCASVGGIRGVTTARAKPTGSARPGVSVANSGRGRINTHWGKPWGSGKGTADAEEIAGEASRGGKVGFDAHGEGLFTKEAGSGEEEDVADKEGLAQKQTERTGVEKEIRAGVARRGVLDSVRLSTSMRGGNELWKLVSELEEERVEHVPAPVNGDHVYVLQKENMLSNRIRDSEFWLQGKPTTMATLDNVRVRKWKCGGGKVCRNEGCKYRERYGRENKESFEQRGGERWLCFFCKKEVERLGGECEAQKWTVTSETEVAYCHKGVHNHPLGQVENQGLEDKWHLEVMAQVSWETLVHKK